jgi:hypothetical protein
MGTRLLAAGVSLAIATGGCSSPSRETPSTYNTGPQSTRQQGSNDPLTNAERCAPQGGSAADVFELDDIPALLGREGLRQQRGALDQIEGEIAESLRDGDFGTPARFSRYVMSVGVNYNPALGVTKAEALGELSVLGTIFEEATGAPLLSAPDSETADFSYNMPPIGVLAFTATCHDQTNTGGSPGIQV